MSCLNGKSRGVFYPLTLPEFYGTWPSAKRTSFHIYITVTARFFRRLTILRARVYNVSKKNREVRGGY